MTTELTELQAAAERLTRDYPDRSPSVTLYNFSRMRMDDCCEAAVALPLLLARLADLERLREVVEAEKSTIADELDQLRRENAELKAQGEKP